jgi:hypothetical protein
MEMLSRPFLRSDEANIVSLVVIRLNDDLSR